LKRWHGKNRKGETNHGYGVSGYRRRVVVHFPFLAIPKLGLEHHDALANEGGDYGRVEQSQDCEYPHVVVHEHEIASQKETAN
jgi:hypothetical protein